MAKTLEALRTELAQRVARYVTGTATGGSTTTIIDTGGLAHFTEDDALKGARAYIADTTDEAAPEGEDRHITGYTAATKTITVSEVFSAAVGAGDIYEVYLAPLTLEQWALAINLAIQGSWPAIWRRVYDSIVITGAASYFLDTGVDEVDSVEVIPTFGKAGLYGREIPRQFWHVEGQPGSLTLYLQRPIATTNDLEIHVFYKARFAELAAGESTSLDPGYLLAAARAEWYGMMADAARGQADVARYLQLMNHWQEIAERRKYELAATLAGAQPKEGKEK
jgi:hypothetical protein